MYTNSKIAKAVRLALLLGATSAISAPAFSAEEKNAEEKKVERIQVTGSSIKRTDIEGSLPITVITSADILKTGVTSVPDLIAKIPSMQGFTAASQSVGGGGGGISTASLRGIGEEYTLVLLNGKRLAPAGSGSAVDVNAIPIATIERVEILTDGASALYGSDAIAGVINFILKRDIQETTFTARYDSPEAGGGGKNGSFSLTTGYGDISNDGFNVYFSYSKEDQEELASRDRKFAQTGIIPFSHNGADLVFVADSANAIPANHFIGFSNGFERELNPYSAANGACGPNNVPSTNNGFDDDGNQILASDICRFDFTSTLEIIPEYVRDNVLLGGVLELNDTTELYSTMSYTEVEVTSRIAPYPTGGFPVAIDSPLFLTNVYPHLTPEEQGFVDAGEVDYSVAAWRALPGGNRTNEFSTDSLFLDLGIRGEWNDISYDFSVNYSKADSQDTILTGYPIEEDFLALLGSGNLDVFTLPENLSAEEISALQATMFNGVDTTTETELVSIQGSFSAPIFELPAGDVYLGGGFDYRETSYSRRGSEANQRAVILFADPDPQFDLERDTVGTFLEAIVPVFEGFEVTAAVRYDDISGIDNTTLQNPIAGSDQLLDLDGNVIADGAVNKIGDDLSDTTYKVSVSYRPNDDWLFRASFGTGFKAPTMRQVAEPRISFGVTGGTFACPFTGSDPLAQFCRTGTNQYDVFREGNGALKPEESEQVSLGFVYSPGTDFSITVDYWEVELENVVQRPTEQNIFDDPVTFRELYTTKLDEGRGEDFLAIIRGPVNVGQSNNSGIDWTLSITNDLGWGSLVTDLSGSYVIESESLKVGTTDEWETSLGQKGPDDEVVLRNKIRIVNSLSHDDFIHTLSITYQSGWTDEFFAGGNNQIRLADDLSTNYTGGVQLDVPSHAITDWLTQYNFDESLTLSFGINNLLDKLPPLALGENGGHQEGFDPRYFDSYGRTFYLTGSYTF